LLRDGFDKGKISVSIPDDDKAAGKVTYSSKEAILNRLAPNRESRVVDADGNVTSMVVEAGSPLFSSRYFDEQTKDLVETAQILYIESGVLKSYVPYISPKYAVFTSWGQKLGISNSFTTGFNKDRSISSAIRKKAVFMGTTTTGIRLDTISQETMLKQLYGQNIVQALWLHLDTKRYEFYRLDSMIKIPFEKINIGLVQNLSVPVYDAEGNVTGSKKIFMDDQPLNPSMMSSVQIVQNWYYHAERNLVFNKITELVLYAKKSPGEAGVEIAAPILKIMLK
jgi:hypothetical protein